MKTSRLWLGMTALACVSTMGVGCGKKDKKGADAPASPVEAWVVTQASVEGGTMVVYNSNIKGAKFKCMVEVDGQAGTWQDCAAEGLQIPVESGRKYVFKVKAIAPDGRESETASQSLIGRTTGTVVSLQTEILNKADVSDVYAKPSLRLTFGVSGGQANLDDMRFECKREAETAFRLCQEKTPGAPDNEYDFGRLVDGQRYSLSVRAVPRSGNAAVSANEDTVSFTVKMKSVVIGGEDKLRTQTTGSVTLTFEDARQAGQTVRCSLDNSESTDCSTGYEVPLSLLQAGMHKLTVETRDTVGNAVAQSIVDFCAKECGDHQAPPPPALRQVPIGSLYSLIVPQGMHVTTIASDKTLDEGQLTFYRVFSGLGPNRDPIYNGNYPCNNSNSLQGTYDDVVVQSSPSGSVYHYCKSTTTEEAYKTILTNGRLARNHLSVVTDAEFVSEHNHERIMFNAFDADVEFMMDRSLFERQCEGERGRIEWHGPVRVIERNFFGEPVYAEFYTCQANRNFSNGGLPFGELWWVGGFFLSSDGQAYPKTECFNQYYSIGNDPHLCGEYRNPSLLEVVYMARGNYRSVDFVRAAQERLKFILGERSPLRR